MVNVPSKNGDEPISVRLFNGHHGLTVTSDDDVLDMGDTISRNGVRMSWSDETVRNAQKDFRQKKLLIDTYRKRARGAEQYWYPDGDRDPGLKKPDEKSLRQAAEELATLAMTKSFDGSNVLSPELRSQAHMLESSFWGTMADKYNSLWNKIDPAQHAYRALRQAVDDTPESLTVVLYFGLTIGATVQDSRSSMAEGYLVDFLKDEQFTWKRETQHAIKLLLDRAAIKQDVRVYMLLRPLLQILVDKGWATEENRNDLSECDRLIEFFRERQAKQYEGFKETLEDQKLEFLPPPPPPPPPPPQYDGTEWWS